MKSILTLLIFLSPPLLAVPGSVSAGGYHFAGIADGQAIGMGDGTYGQLGTNPSGTPATIGGLTNVSQVAAGVFSTIALKTDGTVWFLGDHSVQHTTPHGTPQAVTTPQQVPGLAGIGRIAAGHRHFLALETATGNLFAWGHNGSGQLGNGSLLDLSNPALVLTGVAAMAAGNGFSAAVKTNGELWTWGRNSHGQLGLGDTQDRHVPTQVTAVANAAAVAAGGNHLLLLLTDQTVRSCGDNSFGQLGNNSTVRATTPVVVAGLSGIDSISAGWNHSAALGTTAYLWGRNLEGQCGGGPASPVQLAVPSTLTLIHPVTAIACGGNFTILTLANDALWGCGSNADGQLISNTVAVPGNPQNVLTPQLVIHSTDTGNFPDTPITVDGSRLVDFPTTLEAGIFTRFTHVDAGKTFRLELTAQNSAFVAGATDDWIGAALNPDLSNFSGVTAGNANGMGFLVRSSNIGSAHQLFDTSLGDSLNLPGAGGLTGTATAGGPVSFTYTFTLDPDYQNNGLVSFDLVITDNGPNSPYSASGTFLVNNGLGGNLDLYLEKRSSATIPPASISATLSEVTAASAELKITGVSFDGLNFTIQFTGEPNTSYDVTGDPDLQSGFLTVMASPATDGTGTGSSTFPVGSNRFFRVQTQ